MGFFSRKKIDTKGGDPISSRDNAMFNATFEHIAAGQPISVTNTNETIKNGYLKSDTVFSVINKVSSLGNGVKWQVYEVQDNVALTQLKQMQHKSSDILKYIKLHKKALSVIDTGVSLDRLIDRPNDYQSMAAFWTAWCNYYLITGNTYSYGLRRLADKATSPIISMHVPHPSETQLILSNNFTHPIRGYRFAYYGKEVADTEVWHTKMFNPDFEGSYKGLIGKSPLEVGSNLVAVDIEGVANQAAKFANDGIRGILTGQGDMSMMNGIGTSNSAEIDKLKTDYYRQMSSRAEGLGSKIKDILFHSLPLQWLKIGQTAQEMDTVSTLTEVKKRIYALYSVPYQDDPKYSNATVWRKDAIISGVMPVLEQFKEMLNMFLLKSWEGELGANKYYIDYDMIASFPELQDDLSATITAVNSAEFMTIDEKRELIYKDPYPDPMAKQILIAFGKVPLSNLGANDPNATVL